LIVDGHKVATSEQQINEVQHPRTVKRGGAK